MIFIGDDQGDLLISSSRTIARVHRSRCLNDSWLYLSITSRKYRVIVRIWECLIRHEALPFSRPF